MKYNVNIRIMTVQNTSIFKNGIPWLVSYSISKEDISSSASIILGPGACINNIGSNSLTLPFWIAGNRLNPGIFINVPDNFGAGGGFPDSKRLA